MTLLETLTPVAPTGLYTVSWLMIAIPLVVAGLLLLAGKVTDAWGHWVATVAPIVSFLIACVLFVDLWGRDIAQRAVSVPMYDWVTAGPWTIKAGLLIDPLSILFALLITGVGSLIHVYSIGYMAEDPGRRRFFAYLNLFIAAMLTLVLADNYLALFLGWEGVGLASYLLISFWQHKPTAATAGKKAFVVNRVGDLGMLMAIFTMLAMFGSSSFVDVNQGMGSVTPFWATMIGVFLLVGACGKSAQVPLQSWLLDAMEGPTPVSALIHAATMVTAGVYLVVRSHAVYEASEVAALAVAIVGTVTLLFGAWIGCSKDDIKKVLAGSTMSQIGYMMLAAGIGPEGYAFAIFHLLTHGFFKANMFLGAGSVMHGMHNEVDMRRYGALRRYLPYTFWTFAMGYLAIIGAPMFSGFYSKDHIIEAAWEHSPFMGLLALVGAGVTAFYMTRLMLMTFFGEKRWAQGVHPHESPAVMWVPLALLAIPSVLGGVAMNAWIQSWLAPAVNGADHHLGVAPPLGLMTWVTFVVVAFGVFLGWWYFGRGPIPATVPYSANLATIAGRNDLYGDAFNENVFMKPGQALTAAVTSVDKNVVDGIVHGSAQVALGFGSGLRRLQNGYVRSYGLTMVIGLLVIGLVLVVGRLV